MGLSTTREQCIGCNEHEKEGRKGTKRKTGITATQPTERNVERLRYRIQAIASEINRSVSNERHILDLPTTTYTRPSMNHGTRPRVSSSHPNRTASVRKQVRTNPPRICRRGGEEHRRDSGHRISRGAANQPSSRPSARLKTSKKPMPSTGAGVKNKDGSGGEDLAAFQAYARNDGKRENKFRFWLNQHSEVYKEWAVINLALQMLMYVTLGRHPSSPKVMTPRGLIQVAAALVLGWEVALKRLVKAAFKSGGSPWHRFTSISALATTSLITGLQIYRDHSDRLQRHSLGLN